MNDEPSGQPLQWRGHWIAADLPDFAPEATSIGGDLPPSAFSRVQFRRTFELPEPITQNAPLRVAADSRYVLWVNGVEVGRGPARSQPRRMRYDEYDIAGHLRPGRNVLAVLVTYYGRANSFWQPAAASGVLGRDAQLVLDVDLADGDGCWLRSDESWRAQRSMAWRALATGAALDGVPIELLDARALNAAWVEADFDDTTWPNASILRVSHIGGRARSQPPSDPYGAMAPRGIGYLTGASILPVSSTVQRTTTVGDAGDHPAARVIAHLRAAEDAEPASLPIQISTDRTTVVTFDFGRIVAGHVEFDVTAPAGVRLDLWYQEAETFDPITGPPESAPRASASYVTRGSVDRFRAMEINGLRRISMVVPAEAGRVVIDRMAVREYRYPFEPGAQFSSSDPELDRLHRAGIRTTELNSFDAFTDCPTREQRAWVGDGVVHQMVHLVANTDWRLARNYLTLGASPRPDGMLPMTVVGEIEHHGGFSIPDWALHWVHGVWVQFRHDGDRDRTLSLLPVVERILRWYEPYIDEHGTLSDVAEWNLIDWSSVFSNGRSSLSTGLWARALAEYADLCDSLGNAGSAAWARAHWARARVGFEAFWDDGRSSYVDHIVDGVVMPAMSQAAGAVAIVSGLAPRDRWAQIIETITDRERVVVRSWIGGRDGGYDMTKIHDQAKGIYRIDWDVEREIVRAQPFFSYVVHDAVAAAGRSELLIDLVRDWSVFLHDGYDTFGECWGWGTPVHAWSATPTRDLIWYVLGVTPAAPGYATVQVAPRAGSVAWLRGSVPTPRGLVHVDIDSTTGVVTVDSPIPICFVALDGARTEAPAGTHAFSLQ